ncbi:hypothetical protein T4D_4474 [Trichinella pseudospiralis]|uniref:Secreted protein n=1 Tax=Trichinella pseudospiralis TaxID=6337 RepID=A0A0V1FJP5_TRIPS|nr:hypothetical protein T4D_4474 [Trichinella pseudospiralis]
MIIIIIIAQLNSVLPGPSTVSLSILLELVCASFGKSVSSKQCLTWLNFDATDGIEFDNSMIDYFPVNLHFIWLIV